MWFFNFDWSPAVVMYSSANYFLRLRREANPGASRALIWELGCEISVFLISLQKRQRYSWLELLCIEIYSPLWSAPSRHVEVVG